MTQAAGAVGTGPVGGPLAPPAVAGVVTWVGGFLLMGIWDASRHPVLGFIALTDTAVLPID